MNSAAKPRMFTESGTQIGVEKKYHTFSPSLSGRSSMPHYAMAGDPVRLTLTRRLSSFREILKLT